MGTTCRAGTRGAFSLRLSMESAPDAGCAHKSPPARSGGWLSRDARAACLREADVPWLALPRGAYAAAKPDGFDYDDVLFVSQTGASATRGRSLGGAHHLRSYLEPLVIQSRGDV